VPGDKEQVLWLDVEVLEPVFRANHIQGFGCFFHVAEKFFTWNSWQTRITALRKTIMKLAIGQFHDHHQFAISQFNSFEGEEIGVPECFDLLERREFPTAFITASSDELYCLV
jgi:hypothetical protein